MSLPSAKKLLMNGARRLRVEDVFATRIYTGNGTDPITISSPIDLLGKGGLVWTKQRSDDGFHQLFDTIRGGRAGLSSNNADIERVSNGIGGGNRIDFLSNGHRVNVNSDRAFNGGGQTYASWIWRFAKNFLVAVTYMGNGQAGRKVSHPLGGVPGMMFVKARTASADWAVWHRSTPVANDALVLNSTAGAPYGSSMWGAAPTATNFTVSDQPQVNQAGVEYVAYLFGHNPDLIDCGKFTNQGSTDGPTVVCGKGWRPQWVFIKRLTGSGGRWAIFDNKRPGNFAGNDGLLSANSNLFELNDADYVSLVSNGFRVRDPQNGVGGEINGYFDTMLYVAVREPSP